MSNDQNLKNTHHWMESITDSLDGNLRTVPVAFKYSPKTTFPQFSVMVDENIELSHWKGVFRRRNPSFDISNLNRGLCAMQILKFESLHT